MPPGGGLARVVQHLRRQYGAAPGDGELLGRFVHERDESAFATLVQRHGGLVLGVARRQLADRQQAEDIAQATFLALARQSARLGQPPSLVNWLYTVALRLARKAKVRAARQMAGHLRLTPPGSPPDPLAEVSGRELVAVIDQELSRLSEEYRLPLLLCAVEGMSREEAARRLGWTAGAVKGRLERGRELLRTRLERRGLTVPAVLTGLLVADGASAVPPMLVATTSRAALAALTAPAAWVSFKVLTVAAVVLVAGVGSVALLASAGREPERPEAVLTVAHAPGSQAQPAAPPRVDAEGVPLPQGVLARLGSSRLRHSDSNILWRPMAFAPDGRSFATGGMDSVRIWDVASGKLLLPIDLENCQDLHYAADGRELLALRYVSASDGRAATPLELRAIDPATGRELRRVAVGQNRYSERTAFSPSGRLLAIGNYDDKLTRVFDTATGRQVLTISTGFLAWGIDFSSDEKTLAIASPGVPLRLHDLATGAVTAELNRDQAQFIFVRMAPDGRTLATCIEVGQGSTNAEVELWDIPMRRARFKLTVDGLFRPVGITFSPDARLVAVCGQLDDVVLFETATGKEVRRLHGTVMRVLNTTFAPDGKTLAAANDRGAISLYDVDSGQRLPISADPIILFHGLRYTDAGRRLLGVATPPIVWDAATGREVHRYPDLPIFGVRTRDEVSPDGRLLALPNRERTIQLLDAATGRELHTIAHKEKEYFLQHAFTPDSRRLIGGDGNGVISVWEVADGKLLREMGGPTGGVRHLVVSPDGLWLASANVSALSASAIRLWDLATFQEVRRFTPRGSAFDLAFSPDGRRLASVGGEAGRPSDRGEVQLWDIDSGKELRSFEGHTAQVSSVAFSPDGRMLATGGLDTTLRLWEIATGGERQRITGHKSKIHAIAFAPDGRTVAASSSEAPVYVWDVLGRSEQPAQPPTAAELEQAWAALAGADAKAAFQPIRRLVAVPGPATAFLREKLPPAVPTDGQRVRELIRLLDSARFAERQHATAELERLSDRAAAELRAALKDGDTLEVRLRLQQLVDRIDAGTPDTLQAQRAVEALEYIGTPPARQLLRALAGGAAGAILTDAAAAALKRLEK